MDGNGLGAQGVPGTEQVEIAVTEPLNLAGVRRLGPVVDAVIARRPARLVMDMSACPHLDAAGIGLLLDTHRRMWRLGGVLTLRSPSSRIRRLLQVARVDQVFHVTSDLPVGGAEGPAAGCHDPSGPRHRARPFPVRPAP